MENTPQQPIQPKQPSWWSLHHTGTTIVVALIILIIASLIAWSQYKNEPQTANSCIEGTMPEDCNDTVIIETDPETVGWKTYTNQKYGFELKYPQDELLSEVSNVDWVVLALHDKNDRQEFNFIVNVDQPGMGFEGMDIVSSTNITIGGVKALKQVLEMRDGHEKGMKIALYSFEKDNHEYLIQASGDYQRADEILATLKFN